MIQRTYKETVPRSGGILRRGIWMYFIVGVGAALLPVSAYPQSTVATVNGATVSKPAYPFYQPRMLDAAGNVAPICGAGGNTPGCFGYNSTPPFTNTYYLPNKIYENGFTDATLSGMLGDVTHSNANTCGQIISLKSTVGQNNCYAGYQVGGPGSNVVYYSASTPGAAGQTMWGANFNMGDSPTKPGTLFGIEVDLNPASDRTAGAVLFTGANANSSQPAALGVIHIPAMQFYDGTPAHRTQWSYGFISDDGAVGGAGVQLGSRSISANSESQPIIICGRNAANKSVCGWIYTNATGQIVFKAPPGVQVIGDMAVTGTAYNVNTNTQNLVVQNIKAKSGTRFVCVDTSGKIISSTTPCSGT